MPEAHSWLKSHTNEASPFKSCYPALCQLNMGHVVRRYGLIKKACMKPSVCCRYYHRMAFVGFLRHSRRSTEAVQPDYEEQNAVFTSSICSLSACVWLWLPPKEEFPLLIDTFNTPSVATTLVSFSSVPVSGQVSLFPWVVIGCHQFWCHTPCLTPGPPQGIVFVSSSVQKAAVDRLTP